MADFGTQLAAALQAKGLTRSAFARAAGSPASLVTEVIRGQRKPPLARLDAWSRLLLSSEAERLAFVRAGALAHCPLVVQTWVGELRAAVPTAAPKRRK